MISMLSLSLVLGFFADYDLDSRSLDPTTSDLSADQAYRVCRGVLKLLMESEPNGRPMLCLETLGDRRIWTYVSDRSGTVQIAAKDGALIHFDSETATSTRSTEPYTTLFSTGESIENRFDQLASLAGVPSGVKRVTVKNGNVSNRGSFSPWVTATYSVSHKDREVIGCWANYAFDLRTGMATYIDQWFDYSVRNEEPTLEAWDALATAKDAYAASLKSRVPYEYDPAIPPRLVYEMVDHKTPSVKTIAYLVFFGKDTVTIDSVTGKPMRVAYWPRRAG